MKFFVLFFCFNFVSSEKGEPVFLTEYVKRKDFEGARKASLAVLPEFKNVRGHSGYFTVNEKCDSNLFFWYFPAENGNDAPVVAWLQGGPGAPSVGGLFVENGPFMLNSNGTLSIREWRWSKFSHMIYIDSPVGTGFSFTNGCYAKNETMIGDDLENMIRQFFLVFDHLKNNEFYIAGESYGGKYAPAMAYTIHKTNQKSKEKINLKGISIGNGFCDPINQLDYGDFLYEIGLIDDSTKIKFIQFQNQIKHQINEKIYLEAFHTLDKLIFAILVLHNSTFFYNKTGFLYNLNYLHTEKSDHLYDLFKNEEIRMNINVGNMTFNSPRQVQLNLASNFMKSVKPWFEILIENYRVLTYNGQLDIIVAYPLTINFLKRVKWSGSEEYKTAQRNIWYVGSEIAGYSKRVKGFTEVLVRNAGHMVPADQPHFAYELINKFVNNIPI